MYLLRQLTKKIQACLAVVLLVVVTNFSAPVTSPYIANKGLKTEARASSANTCEQACTLNNQGSYSRSSATLALLDDIVASIPPGSLSVFLALSVFSLFVYLRSKQCVYVSSNVQQYFCLWRF